MTTPHDDLFQKAKEDYSKHRGRILLVTQIDGYKDNDSVTVVCDPPARVRVVDTPISDINHWNDEWLDPYWDVELVAPHPSLEGIRGLWVLGTSYSQDGKTEPTSTWTVENTTLPQRIRDRVRKVLRRSAHA